MPRSADAQLIELLNGCETQSTVDIRLRSGTPHFFSTNVPLNLGENYTPRLLKVGGLHETGTQAVNRVSVAMSNVDLQWGLKLASELRGLELADVTIKRLFRNPKIGIFQHKHFFSGKLVGAAADEKQINFDVIPKTTASGLSLAIRMLSPLCAWIFKDPRTCKYLGLLLTCNLVRKSRGGCRGRENEEHNGGFAFPENPTQAAPGASGNSLPGAGAGENPCFVEGTRVFTHKGEQRIETIKEFWRVYSFNPQTQQVELDTVEEVFEHVVTGYFEFTFSDGASVKVTPEHPFFTEAGEFVRADDLRIPHEGERGSVVRRFCDDCWRNVELKQMKWHSGQNVKVYNLHVLRNHTYFANRFAVHNSKDPNAPLI
jgi:hypothetical protein